MRIFLERSGGFHPPLTKLRCQVDTMDLGPDEARRLRELVAEARRAPVTPHSLRDPSREAFAYEIAVREDDGSEARLRAVQGWMPTPVSALVRWLERLPCPRSAR